MIPDFTALIAFIALKVELVPWC